MLIKIDESGQALNTKRIEYMMIEFGGKFIIKMFSGKKIYVSDKVHSEICKSFSFCEE